MNKFQDKKYLLVVSALAIIASIIVLSVVYFDKLFEFVQYARLRLIDNSKQEMLLTDNTKSVDGKSNNVTSVVISPQNSDKYPRLTETKFWDELFYEDSKVDTIGRVVLTKRAKNIRVNNANQIKLNVTLSDNQVINIIITKDTKIYLPKYYLKKVDNKLNNVGIEKTEIDTANYISRDGLIIFRCFQDEFDENNMSIEATEILIAQF